MLVHTGDMSVDRTGAIILAESVTRFTKFLSNMLLPFVSGYWVRMYFIEKVNFVKVDVFLLSESNIIVSLKL